MVGPTRQWLEELPAEIGKTVRDARKSLGLSQTDLADQMTALGQSWHQTTAAKVEAGTRPIRFSEAIALSLVLQMVDVTEVAGPELMVKEFIANHYIATMRQEMKEQASQMRAVIQRQLGDAAAEVWDEQLQRMEDDQRANERSHIEDRTITESLIDLLREGISEERLEAAGLKDRIAKHYARRPSGNDVDGSEK